MPPQDLTLPKRKRGRPSNASKIAEANARAQAGLPPRPASTRRKKKSSTFNTSQYIASRRSALDTFASGSRATEPAGRPAVAAGRRNIPQPTSGPIFQRQARDDFDSPVPERPRPATTVDHGNRRVDRDADSEAEADEDAMPPSPPKDYPHVASRFRRVHVSKIKNDWSPLAEPTRVTISKILQLAHRPIIQRQAKNNTRRAHTMNALRIITGRIGKKISRGLPFPPASMTPVRGRGSGAAGRPRNTVDGGREAELNFESVLDAKRALERQLDPALHAIDLLVQEKERLLEQLEMDRQKLGNLEAASKAQARENRELLRRAHPLAPDEHADKGEDGDTTALSSAEASVVNPFTHPASKRVAPLIPELAKHMESLQSNLEQTSGLIPEIAHSKAVLQDLLSRYLDSNTYERVILGP